MKLSGRLVVAGCFLGLAAVCSRANSQPETLKVLRGALLQAESPLETAEGYQALFEKAGRTGLAKLTQDEDTGIALQASWEWHKKAAKRDKSKTRRAADIYDATELKKFLKAVTDRTKAPIPEWWSRDLLNIDVQPGKGPSCRGLHDDPTPEFKKAKAGGEVVQGAELERKDEILIYTEGGQTVRFPEKTFGQDSGSGHAFTAAWTEKMAVVTAYISGGGGFRYELAGFGRTDGKLAWIANVWAVDRMLLAGHAPHRVELVAKGESIFVFGEEIAGMYIEAFDAGSGKCSFRFCTSYWGNYSESWNIK